MGHGKKESTTKLKKGKRTKVWKILNGTYKKQTPIQADVERLIAAIQQELEWDKKDIATWHKIQLGITDWSGDVRSKRRTRKNIRRRS
jgi:hypothetical protein